jgi:hypothetical protein
VGRYGRFRDVLSKEYSGILPELLWGKKIPYKMLTNSEGQSDIVTHKTNNLNKVYTMPKGIFTT